MNYHLKRIFLDLFIIIKKILNKKKILIINFVILIINTISKRKYRIIKSIFHYCDTLSVYSVNEPRCFL